jgi:WD40 repeat protein
MTCFPNVFLTIWLAAMMGTLPGRAETPESLRRRTTDRYGDTLPPGALTRLGTVRFRHNQAVWDIAFAPDGKTLVTIDRSTVYWWDAATGRELRRREGAFRTDALALAPDGKSLATATDDGVLVLDAASGKELRRFPAPGSPLQTLAYSPDGKMLACITQDNDLRLSDAATGKVLHRWAGQPNYKCPPLAFFPDSRTLIFAPARSIDIPVYDIATGKEVRRFVGHNGFIFSATLSPDGKTLASSATDALCLWDAGTGRQLLMIKDAGRADRLIFSPDGTIVASANEKIRLWDTATAKLRRTCEGEVTGYHDQLVFSPDGKNLVARQNHTLCFWDVASGKKLIAGGGHEVGLAGVALSADARLVFTTDSGRVNSGNAIRQWDAATGRELGRLPGLGFITGPALSPDGRFLAAGNVDGTIHLWDPGTRREVRTLTGHKGRVESVAFAGDSRRLASLGAHDRTIRIWDAATGRQLREIAGSQQFPVIGGIALTPDGKTIIQGGDAKPSLVLWDVATRKRLDRFADPGGPVMGIALSPDGRTLASSAFPGVLRIWDMASGKEVGSIPGSNPALPLAFSPDGRMLATCGLDKVVRLWEVTTGIERCRFTGHRGVAHCGAFSADGRKFFSGSVDTTVLVWDVTGRLAEGQPETMDLSAPDLEQLFADLSSGDASRAHGAIWTLVAAPKQAAVFLGRRLRPVAAADPERVARCIADLGKASFMAREKAAAEIAKLGEGAIVPLRKALTDQPALEARRRVEELLDRATKPSSDRLQSWRAVEVLEHIASPEAQLVLRTLAQGIPEARLTNEAKSSLERLASRRITSP